MKLAIMQPYFFPYIGYYQLVRATDRFVFFDTPQYERRGWMNRNRILNLTGEFTYITVPIEKTAQKTPINKVRISKQTDWRKRIVAQLGVYEWNAPYYRETMQVVSDVLYAADESLAALNIASIVKVCEYLGAGLNYDVFSKMDLQIRGDCEPDEWALEIAKAMGYHSYVNTIGGMAFFDTEKYKRAEIELEFLQSETTPYIQRVGRFVPNLSIIDVMMFNSKEQIGEMLERYKLI